MDLFRIRKTAPTKNATESKDKEPFTDALKISGAYVVSNQTMAF